MVSSSRGSAQTIHIAGEAGDIETLVEEPAAAPRGIALVTHPHPLFGGTSTNKVVHTLARTFNALGYVALRPNFRGVGASQGEHDRGQGETADMLSVLEHARQHYGNLPVVLAGFSFGAYVQTRVASKLAAAGAPAERLVLVAPAVGRVAADRSYEPATVPADTIIIHGDQDTTVPLANVQDWAAKQQLPVLVVEGSDHFFHRRLGDIKTLIKERWH